MTKSEEALVWFRPILDEMFGENTWVEQACLPTTSCFGKQKVQQPDFVVPFAVPPAIIEHKITLSPGSIPGAKAQVDSYAMNANYSQKLPGKIAGIITDGNRWLLRMFDSGIPLGLWSEVTTEEILFLVSPPSEELDYEDRYRWSPGRTDTVRYGHEKKMFKNYGLVPSFDLPDN